jgi:hypothetical protein
VGGLGPSLLEELEGSLAGVGHWSL